MKDSPQFGPLRQATCLRGDLLCFTETSQKRVSQIRLGSIETREDAISYARKLEPLHSTRRRRTSVLCVATLHALGSTSPKVLATLDHVRYFAYIDRNTLCWFHHNTKHDGSSPLDQ